MGDVIKPRSNTWRRRCPPYIPRGQHLSVFTSVVEGSCAVLPGSGVEFGEKYIVVNHSPNALLVYPELDGQIGLLGVDIPATVAPGRTCEFTSVGENQWAHP